MNTEPSLVFHFFTVEFRTVHFKEAEAYLWQRGTATYKRYKIISRWSAALPIKSPRGNLRCLCQRAHSVGNVDWSVWGQADSSSAQHARHRFFLPLGGRFCRISDFSDASKNLRIAPFFHTSLAPNTLSVTVFCTSTSSNLHHSDFKRGLFSSWWFFSNGLHCTLLL